MNVPESLKKKIEQKIQEIADSSKQEVELARRVEKRKADLGAMRVARHEEIFQYRVEICNWLEELFFRTEEIRWMFAMQKFINVFSARFRNGLPMSADDISAYALIQIEPDGGVNYLERSRYGSSKLPLGNIHYPSTMSLYSELHPDFLKQWAEEIKTGKVWQDIENSLR